MRKQNIAIIGGGACGVAAFIELVLQLIIAKFQQEVKISIIEKSGNIGEGLAFGTKQPGHILNTQADLMGLHAHEPSHYSEWLKSNRTHISESEIKDDEDAEESFTTRRLYSTYLQEQFKVYAHHAHDNNLEIQFIYDEVTHITSLENGFQLIMNDAILQSDYVILAPGTPKSNNYSEFDKVNEYIDFPWPSKNLLAIPSDASVGILGTGLSAIDAIMTLVDNNHHGLIKLFSPDGFLPRVQSIAETTYTLKHLTLSNIHALKRQNLREPTIKDLLRLFKKEVQTYYGKNINWKTAIRKGRSAKELLDEDINVARAGGDAFINILRALRYDSSIIWSWLSNEEKKKFIDWIGTEWTINRHAMPMYNALKMKRLLDDKRISVYGNFKEVIYNAQAHKFFIQHKGEDSVEYLINATGPGSKVKEMKSKLLQNLSSSGIIEPHEIGGIRINTQSMQVLSSQLKTDQLYAVGHVCNGLLFDVNAVWFNIKTIARMTQHILSKVHDWLPLRPEDTKNAQTR